MSDKSVREGKYLFEVGAVGKIESQQGLGLDENMSQLGTAIQVQMCQLWT